VGNGIVLQGNMECGICPERPISYLKTGMILIGSKPRQGTPGLHSLRFTDRDTGSLSVWGRVGRVAVDNFL